ncbi:formate dehydrogenase subunit gamma [Vibrio aestuarianus]|uniref:Formate dehydrogenase -O, gamma subunit n=1 Tax=Vibrio aestuarianus TaxID=28171 RepID=A0ABM9FQ64_9VIBR|nr:formate dehydrogenase subunit gamma [Vibrio aestuarianus]MDE1228390.1 formate dehydrogenase subunit gamma [Vibrio aestuarianus]MDE1256642.1 formate dehydrogenase subunit gamma [Vibrio aestuarianus]MDE1270757.1 formate dehydrogenase subunit gamma [Vibrio aestuarianus]MDE1291764.1 formate dehydrogenase subunit gamma [Vibrio aestuarianus]MDE1305936.1 formate dehydrogenase subunit gamma [Vibrio aestuarianus]
MLQRIKRATLAMLPVLAALAMLCSSPSFAKDETTPVVEREMTQLAGADFWKQVRQGEVGYTTSQSPEHGMLISAPGEAWFLLKEKWMSPAGAIAIFGSITMVILAYVLVGPLMLSAPRTGKKIKRWSRWDRALHWSMAFTFLTLAFSGLMLVYGKHFLKPYVPTELWGWVIFIAKQYHNYMGPLFFILLICMLLKWWRKSLFNMVDIKWFMKFGGMVGKYKGSHPSAEFSNGAEKVIYWLLIVFGTVAAISGLVLNFPIFGQTRRDMEFSNLIHMFSALILICGFIFHIYIGLFGMEGALEGMVTGEVDETWAKEHHDLWYAEMQNAKHEGTASSDEPVKGEKAHEQ